MNDRFKFRIWDKKLKKLAKWNDNPYHNMEIMNYICVDNPVTDWKHEDYILMQCTGLKDNNGKLIYEGDVVRFYSPYGHATFEIKWSEEFATFGYEDNETDFSEFGRLYDDARYVKVIGNIYENKELLESEG